MLVDQGLLVALFRQIKSAQTSNITIQVPDRIGPTYESNMQFFGEFLLKFIISRILFERLPDCSEDKLHEVERQCMADETFNDIVERFHLAEHIQLQQEATYSDVLKTLFGLIYFQIRDYRFWGCVVEQLWTPLLPQVPSMKVRDSTVAPIMQEARYLNLFKRLQYQPKDLSWFQEALTRMTAIDEELLDNTARDCQRLKFLGNHTLNLMVAQLLMKPCLMQRDEQLQNAVSILTANRGVLTKIATELNLAPCIIRGFRESQVTNEMCLDALKAVVGAAYQDSGDEGFMEGLIGRLWLERFGKFLKIEGLLLGNPKDAYTLYKTASIFSELGDNETGLEYVEESLKIEPNRVEFLYTKASLLCLFKRYIEAIPVCSQALQFCPNYRVEMKVRILKLRGSLFENIHEFDEACRSYHEACLLAIKNECGSNDTSIELSFHEKKYQIC